MKTAASVIVLVVMPLGFFVLAAIILNRMLAKRHQQGLDRGYEASALPDAGSGPFPGFLLPLRSSLSLSPRIPSPAAPS